MPEAFTLTTWLAASPADVYNAWLTGARHSAMTGGAAVCAPEIGFSFTAWDGYINGLNLELEPGHRIVQAWRTTEFPDGSEDSRLEILLEAEGEGTRLILYHTNVPDGQGEMYRAGWEEHYFQPMARYFQPASGAPNSAPTLEPLRPFEEPPPEHKQPEPAAAPASSIQKTAAPEPTRKPATKKPAKAVAAKKPAAKKPAKKPAKKAAKKPVKKPAKKAVKKAAKKVAKKAAKKPVKKAAKKSAKKSAKKPTKKAVKKPVKKAAKKPAKKVSKGPAKKPAKKAVKESAKKSGKPAGKRKR